MDGNAVQRLLDRAFLYDDPDAYRAGVQAALREVVSPHSRAEPGAALTAQAAPADLRVGSGGA